MGSDYHNKPPPAHKNTQLTPSRHTLSHEARPAVSGGFEPTKLSRSALACPTDQAQVLGEQIPLLLEACVDLRQRNALCCLAVVCVLALAAKQHEVGSVFHKERFAIKCDDAAIAGVVYLAARAASVRPFVLPVAVHDANAIPSPLLDVYVWRNDAWSNVCIHMSTCLCMGMMCRYVCIHMSTCLCMCMTCRYVSVLMHLQAHVVQHTAHLDNVFHLCHVLDEHRQPQNAEAFLEHAKNALYYFANRLTPAVYMRVCTTMCQCLMCACKCNTL
jgi:hypothetical protein